MLWLNISNRVNNLKIDLGDGIMIILAVFILGAYWSLPKETLYQALVTIIAALIGAGWLGFKSKRKRQD